MPLIYIKSNLANAKFSPEQSQPYIKFTPPPKAISGQSLNSIYFSTKYANIGAIGNTEPFPSDYTPPQDFLDLYNSLRTSVDYPIRGGSVNLNLAEQLYTQSGKIDRTRISRFFKDSPRGTAFIQKQIGLQLTNPKIETDKDLFGFGTGFPVPSQLENTRIYNGGKNTLSQVGAQGTGAHGTRHGTVPFNIVQKNYFATVNKQNVFGDSQGTNQNRLVLLNRLKMISTSSPFVGYDQIGNIIGDINLVNSLGISINKNYLFQYLGGPGSTYGIGTTTIPRRVDTTVLKSNNAMVYSQLKVQKSNEQIVEGKIGYKIQDFRNQIPTLKGAYTPWAGKEVDNRFYVSAGKYVDNLNASSMFVFPSEDTAPWEYNKTDTDDLIKFVFEAISNDNPSDSLAIFFRAFLTAGITDNNSAALNSFKYMGRGENFYTYQGFERSIGFSFRVAAGSKKELIPMYNRLNALISQVYPDYSNNGIMRAPIVRITIGDYLYRMPGFLESVNITVDNGSPWEINLYEDPDLAQLPQVVDVSVSFKPIFEFLPQRVKYGPATLLPQEDSFEDSVGNINQSTTDQYSSTLTGVAPLITNNKVVKSSGIELKSSRTRLATETEIQNRTQFREAVETFEQENPININDLTGTTFAFPSTTNSL